MEALTDQQQAILQFICEEIEAGRPNPSQRELARHFGFASKTAVACHVRALIKKGMLLAGGRKARALRLAESLRPVVVEIPVLGSVPAGGSQEREQENEDSVRVDVATIGLKPTRNTFALGLTGFSMIVMHIWEGEFVIFEHGPDPRPGQIVAAFIDRKNTLKTFLIKNGKPFLKAENPKYPNLIPSEELVIQGVFRALIRKARE